jgi:hypothetical protein
MKEENIQVHVISFSDETDAYDYDYDVVKNGNDVQLFCSKSGDWDTPGAMIGSLLDDGNGVRIKIEDKEIDLDYSIAQQLLVLLLMNNNTRMKFISVKTIKTI